MVEQRRRRRNGETRIVEPCVSLIGRLDKTGVPLALARVIIGGLFIWMGVSKVQDPVGFLKQIRLYEMLPESPSHFLNGTAILLPWLEVICGLALIAGVYLRGAGTMIAIMLATFTPAIFLRAWEIHTVDGKPFFDIAFDCGCGAGEVIIWKKLLSNTLLFLGSLIPVFSGSRRFCLGRRATRHETAELSAPSGAEAL